MSGPARTCPACGETGEGTFCSRCGTRLPGSGGDLACPSCGTAVSDDALYCSECGSPVRRRPRSSLRARLPWILSGLALVAFAAAIALAIGESTSERAEGMPPTGAVIPSPGESDAGGTPGGGARGAADPSRVDLSSMSGREAADRLFDRAMRTEASGDTAGARFFASMGLQAYGGISPAEMDADARFHVGLLHLMNGDPAAARRSADEVLAAIPDHLLAWILRARVAEAEGDEAALAEANRRFVAALDAERASDRPEYAQHQALIDEEARRRGATF